MNPSPEARMFPIFRKTDRFLPDLVKGKSPLMNHPSAHINKVRLRSMPGDIEIQAGLTFLFFKDCYIFFVGSGVVSPEIGKGGQLT